MGELESPSAIYPGLRAGQRFPPVQYHIGQPGPPVVATDGAPPELSPPDSPVRFPWPCSTDCVVAATKAQAKALSTPFPASDL